MRGEERKRRYKTGENKTKIGVYYLKETTRRIRDMTGFTLYEVPRQNKTERK